MKSAVWKQAEQRLGRPLCDVLAPLVNEMGLVAAGRECGAAPATIYRWLLIMGYKRLYVLPPAHAPGRPMILSTNTVGET